MIRWGLLIFVGLAVWQHSAEFFRTSLPLLEPFGFAAFLSTLGYVAAQKYSAAGSTVEGDPKGTGGSPSYSVIDSARRISSSTNFRVAAR